MIFCSNCNQQLDDNLKFCPACGKEVNPDAPAVVVESTPEYQTYEQPNYQQPQQPYGVVPGKGAATAALVLGIVAIVFSYVALVGLVSGIVGLVMTSTAKKEGFVGGMATAGLICSIVGTILAALGTVACFSVGCFGCIAATTSPWYW